MTYVTIVSESQHSYTAVVSGTYPDPHTTIKQAVGGGNTTSNAAGRAQADLGVNRLFTHEVNGHHE